MIDKIKYALDGTQKQNYSTEYNVLSDLLETKQYTMLFEWFRCAFFHNNKHDCNEIGWFIAEIKLDSESDCHAYLNCLSMVSKSIKQEAYISISPLLDLIRRGATKNAKSYVEKQVIAIVKDIYYDLNSEDRGVALQMAFIYYYNKECFNFFIARIHDYSDPGPDTYHGYIAIKAFEDCDNDGVMLLINGIAGFAFNFDYFRSIAMVEMLSTLMYDKKILYHPIEDWVDSVYEYLSRNTQNTKESYVVSLVVSMLFVNTNQVDKIFEKALLYPSLEVNLEAVYCMVLKNKPEADSKFLEFLRDPRISEKAQLYLEHLEKELSIPLLEFRECINQCRANQEFIAQSSLASWLSHENEYGHPPTEIKVAFKTLYHNEEYAGVTNTIYFINYKYIDNREETGCVIMYHEGKDDEFGYPYSMFKKFASVEEAMEGYRSFIEENSDPIA